MFLRALPPSSYVLGKKKAGATEISSSWPPKESKLTCSQDPILGRGPASTYAESSQCN